MKLSSAGKCIYMYINRKYENTLFEPKLIFGGLTWDAYLSDNNLDGYH